MGEFARASRERVNAFAVEEVYLFKYYFEGNDVFGRLRDYYNPSQYRFEVPAAEFQDVQGFLADNGYALVAVAEPAAFAVVVRKYTAHPDNIFKASVLQRSVDGYNCFLLADQDAVDRAVEAGATRFSATDFDLPF